MTNLSVPGLVALPTAAAAREQSEAYASEEDKLIDAQIKQKILDKIAEGKSCVAIGDYLPSMTRKELKKLKYKIVTTSYDYCSEYVIMW